MRAISGEASEAEIQAALSILDHATEPMSLAKCNAAALVVRKMYVAILRMDRELEHASRDAAQLRLVRELLPSIHFLLDHGAGVNR